MSAETKDCPECGGLSDLAALNCGTCSEAPLRRAMASFFREHGSAIAWCPGSHGKLVDDLAAIMAEVAPGVRMPTGADWAERCGEPELVAALRLCLAELDFWREHAPRSWSSAKDAADVAIAAARKQLRERS